MFIKKVLIWWVDKNGNLVDWKNKWEYLKTVVLWTRKIVKVIFIEDVWKQWFSWLRREQEYVRTISGIKVLISVYIKK